MNTIELPGCTPEPLMSYLKALGVFRLVAEQADASVRGCWRGGVFVLQTTLDRDSITKFFLEQYKPTPILAPWNGGSGFYASSQFLRAIEASTAPRLDLFRNAITAARSLVTDAAPKDDAKIALLVQCRSVLADEVVPWLDTCFALGEDGPGYFPLLGTGGNDGRLDFTNNLMQRLGDVISFKGDALPPAHSEGWFASALFADDPGLTAFEKAAVGQFNPGGIGGPNGVQGNFEANSKVNPWDFVLMIEGALLFAGSVARRLGANTTGRATFPFTVSTVAVGYGSATATEETTDGSRAELWLPLWDDPTGFHEVRQLFAEGRAQVNRRQAKNSVEFALAVNLLGVSRGIKAFSRYGFLKRNGLAFLAAPLGRVAVTPRPAARLLDDPRLQAWIDQLRRACREKDKTPARYQSALRDIDQAMFEFATRSELGEAADQRGLLDVLRAIGRVERTLAGGLAFCKEKYIKPLQGLSSQWLEQANDDSAEFALAASLAGIGLQGDVGPLRVFLEEVEAGGFFNWSPGSTSAVWSKRPLAENLAAVFRRRQMEAFRSGQLGVPISSKRLAPLGAVLQFLEAETDDEKLNDLLWGLSAVDWADVETELPKSDERGGILCEFGLARLLVNPLALVPDGERWRVVADESEHATKHDPEVFHAIAAGRPEAVERAARRLRSGGLTAIGHRNRQASLERITVLSPHLRPGRSSRLLATMLFPLSNRDLGRIANAVLYPSEPQE